MEKNINIKNTQPEGNYYDKYNSKNIIEKKIMSNFFATLNKILKPIKYKRVYEIGCGEGYVSNYINNIKKIDKYTATDVSEKVIEKAKGMFNNIEFKTDSIYDISLLDNSVDLVVCCEVLEHIEDVPKALNEIFRVTKKYVLLSVPNEPIWRVCNVLRGKYLKDFGNTPGHINHWNEKEFKKIISKHAKIIKCYKPFPWTMILCKKI